MASLSRTFRRAVDWLVLRRSPSGVAVHTTYEHGQFYAVASGWRVRQLKGAHGTVASTGETPEAAVKDVAEMLEALGASSATERSEDNDG